MIPQRTQPSPPPMAVAVDNVRGRLHIDFVVLVVGLGLFSLLAMKMAPFIPDDSYISFRYAEHLAAGQGLRFNPGEPAVEGYSNFLWIVLLAMTTRLGLNIETAGVFLGGLLGLLSVVLLWVILRRRGRTGWELAVPVGLMALSGPLILYAVSGMETALFAFLLLGIVLAVDGLLTRPTVVHGLLLAFVASLAALTRPEGVLAFLVAALCLLAFEWRSEPQRRRAVLRAVGVATLAFIILQAAYHGWRVGYFAALWPTPFLSKGLGESSIFTSWGSNLRQFLLRQTHYYAPLAYYYAAVGLAALAGVWLAWRRGVRRPVESIALILALAFAAVYLNFVDWMPGMRYYTPLIGLLLIPVSLLGPELNVSNRSGGDRGNPAYLLLAALLALFSLSGLALLRMDAQQLQAGTQASMVELGHWLRETMPPDAVLAMSDVGATPYFSGLRTIDINPESLTDRHIAENGWSADYFFAADPDVVVIAAFSLTKPDFYSVYEELYAMPRFQSTYDRIGIVRNDWYQDRSYWVFVRKGMSPTEAQMATFPIGIHKP